MSVCSATQSNLSRSAVLAKDRRFATSGAPGRPLSGADWFAYFRGNAARHRPVSWQSEATATAEELSAIASSLRAWQLGETSEGNHLRAAAVRYGEQIHDPDYLAAVELFIREEQRHGALLGRFLDMVGLDRKSADWGDSLFRLARYCMRDMEVWTTPVVMVETLALIYYNAIRHATSSVALRTICSQILSDEIPHLHFACERLATIYRRRSRFLLRLTMIVQRLLFAGVATLVWFGHRRGLRAGGYGWRRYWKAAGERMRFSWRLMDPGRYRW